MTHIMAPDPIIVDLTEILSPEVDGSIGEDLFYRCKVEMERVLYKTVLEHHKGNQTKAAASLGLSRFTFRKRLRDVAIVVQRENRVLDKGSR